jgi:hypothetical protein
MLTKKTNTIMYKLLFVALVAISSVGFTSCNVLQSTSKAGVSSSMLSKIGNVLIQDMGSSVLAKAGMGGMASKLNMGTKLSSIMTGDSMVGTFKNMLTSKYGIASKKVDSAYGGFGDLKDVATFIGQNASKKFLSTL